jgi:phosphoglycerate dehydrogenase-like enzyme
MKPNAAGSRVLILDDYQDVARTFGPWADLADLDLDLDVRTTHLDADELRAALAPARVVVAMRERTTFDRKVLAQARQLRLLITTGMANASVDLAACEELGIQVRGTRGLTNATAELTWGLILALLRHIPIEDRTVRDGGWQHTIGTELVRKRLGVVGLGRLGAAVAKVGLAFGMDVVAWSQNLTAERAAEVGVTAVDKEQLFATSDVVTLHLRLSERSRGVVGRSELAAMKPTACMINTSRGPLVDEAALLDALRTGSIAGAGLDVFDIEPLPADHPLRTLPNTVITPHIGYVGDTTYGRWWREVVEDIRAWADGDPLRVLVTRR